MNGNIVKLVFEAVMAGSGFAQMNAASSELMKKMGKLSQGAQILGQAFGTMGGMFGRAIGMILQGGVWGAAAEGIRLVLEMFRSRAEEAKKKVEELTEAQKELYRTIEENGQRSVTKISAENQKIEAQIDLVNRRTKAELELKRAQALASGDTSTANALADDLSKADGRAAVAKAEAKEAAAKRVMDERMRQLQEAQAESRKAEDALAKAQQALKKRSAEKEVTYGGPAGNVKMYRSANTDKEKAAVNSALDRAEAAEELVDNAQAAYEIEAKKWQMAKKEAETVRLEQKAAEEKAIAEKAAAERKAAEEKAEKERKDNERFLAEAKKKALRAAEEEAEAKKKAEKEIQAEHARQWAKEELKSHRERLDNLQKEADFYRQRIADAAAAREKAWSSFVDPSSLDLGDERKSKRQEAIDRARYERTIKDRKWGDKSLDELRAIAGEGGLSRKNTAALRALIAEREGEEARRKADEEIPNLITKILAKMDELMEI